MRRSRASLPLILALAAAPAATQVQAPFIDGSYTMSEQACDKLKALATGGPRNVSSVPWSVNATGFDHGEGGCAFTRVTERRKGREWAIASRCVEHGPRTTRESYVFTRTSATTFAVRLTTPGTSKPDAKPVTYTRCDVPKPGQPSRSN